MELTEGMFWTELLYRPGGTYCFKLNPMIRKYLGLEKDKKGNVKVFVKCERSRRGYYYIGIGKPVKKGTRTR